MLKTCAKALLLAISFSTIAFAAANATTATTTTTTTTTTTPTQDIPGGYSDIALTDKGVQDAANFAVGQMQEGALVKITAAQVQVVAGKNYAIDMILSQNGINYQYHVIVFVPLPGTNQAMQLTNVEAMGQIDDVNTIGNEQPQN